MLQSFSISFDYCVVMKQKKIFLIGIAILLSFLIFTPNAFSQAWDNKWFKLKGKAQGYRENENGKLVRTHFRGTSYVFFSWDSANGRYDLKHWVQNNDGQWVSFNSTFPQPIGSNEALWRDIYTRLQKDDNWIWVYAVTRVRIRYNQFGTIDHAWFSSMGCESPIGSINGQNFGGKCKLRGKMIDPLDLPFNP